MPVVTASPAACATASTDTCSARAPGTTRHNATNETRQSTSPLPFDNPARRYSHCELDGMRISAQWMGGNAQAGMDWDNLKFFLALAEPGSLSGAAKQHRVDHSTVARRVDALESELCVRLVERLTRSYRITAEGERVCEQARSVKSGIAEIVRLARDTDTSPERIVRLSGPPALLSRCLAARRLPLQQEHAGQRIVPAAAV